MRELKFRVWTGSAMIYDVVAGRFGVFYVNPGQNGDGLNHMDSSSLNDDNTKYSDDTPVMQFTGLHDRYGEEIWEGDIIELPSISDKASCIIFNRVTVIWNAGVMALHWHTVELMSPISVYDIRHATQGKVVGNIYEGMKETK